jgi:hypothetical protein
LAHPDCRCHLAFGWDTRPFETVISGPNRMLVLGLPTGRLRRYILDSEDLVAIRTQATGVAGLLSRFLQDYWLEYQQGLDRVAAERIVVSITDLMATAYADVLPAGSDLTPALPVHHSNILNR